MRDDKDISDIPLELRSLMHRCFDEPVGESDFAQLQAALKADPGARLLYGRLAQLHADLISHRQAEALCKEVQLEYQGASVTAGNVTKFRSSPARLWHRVVDVLQAIPMRAAASLLVVGLGLGCGVGILAATLTYAPLPFIPVPWNWRVGQDIVARIESTHDVVWQTAAENPDTPPTLGLRVGQQIRIERGLLEIAYRNGIAVILRGPAVYEIRSEHGGKLFSGRLSVTAPRGAEAFNMETPTGRLQIGTGHFGIDAGSTTSNRSVSIFAFSAVAPGISAAQFVDDFGNAKSLVGGDAIQFAADGLASHVPMPPIEEYPDRMLRSHSASYAQQTISLGNLFDDSKTATLTDAVATDTYQAAAETIDLGVAAVHDGGLDVDVNLAEDGVLFNFANVGGGAAKVTGLPANDTYRSIAAIPIRTTGNDLPFHVTEDDHVRVAEPVTKAEEGIGMSSNELLTFDLNELRKAGDLRTVAMRFVSDRAGINDRELPLEDSRRVAHANLLVVVSTENRVLSAYLNGEAAEVIEHGNVFSLDVDQERAFHGLRYDGKFVTFDVPIPAEARFLTLVSTQIEEEHHDHTVFSGARLVWEPAGHK